MKLPKKAVEDTILEIAGNDGLQLYKLLKGKSNVNEFDIAAQLKLTINQIRNIIYKFEQYNLIISDRKKDRTKGWYIYFFTLNEKQLDDVVLQFKKQKIDVSKKQLERESEQQYYVCPNKCMRLTIENAMEHQFICAECGSLVQPEDKEKGIAKIKKTLKALEEDLGTLEA
jgi:transcription initiation factor TFIIE subunit alpha